MGQRVCLLTFKEIWQAAISEICGRDRSSKAMMEKISYSPPNSLLGLG